TQQSQNSSKLLENRSPAVIRPSQSIFPSSTNMLRSQCRRQPLAPQSGRQAVQPWLLLDLNPFENHQLLQ
ncbi:unnamed protein product, partial [Linum tenue]